MASKSDTPTLTIAERAAVITAHEAKLTAVIAAQASDYEARSKGTLAPEIVPPASEIESRKLARQMLDDHAGPDFMRNFPERTRSAQLELERQALEIVLDHLHKEQAKARAIEGIDWQRETRPKFNRLFRQALLHRAALVGLICELERIKAAGRKFPGADLGELSGWVGGLLEDPKTSLLNFSRAETIAISLRLVTHAELEAAKNAKE